VRDRAGEKEQLNRKLATHLQQAHHIEMRKKNIRALRMRSFPPGKLVHLEERVTLTLSPEISQLVKAEMERSGRTANEVAEYALRLHCAEMATGIFEVKP
jgi:hypothetical protein